MAISLKKILGAVAPALATAIGGPLAGTAVKEIAKKILGKENATEAEVESALAGASPEQLLKLKELDIQFAKDMATAGIELDRLEVDDRKSARERQVATKDKIPSILALFIVAMFCTIIALLFSQTIPESNRDLFHVLVGTLDGMLLSVMNYEFGSSRSSREKDQVLGKIAQMP